jgi:hypothetical protein
MFAETKHIHDLARQFKESTHKQQLHILINNTRTNTITWPKS